MGNDPAWDKMWAIFHDARALPPAERDAFLQKACAGNRDLLEKARRLLQADEQPGEFLDQPAITAEVPVHNGNEHGDLSGKRIGHYRLKRKIAAGGIGVVYEAVQENPHRAVALKLMRSGIASRSALRRFEFEAQLLARLRHPGIAQVYEAGTHDDGTGAVPFFAMEYIPSAKTITDYANHKQMGTRERLELFGQVCEAVHHAHQKGIIHRDLKPSNILVDSSAQAKVIDFGVARATDSDMAITTLQTNVGQLIGTLQYMSPEQCHGDPNDLDTRSDVYALGVVAYELLCGKPPFDLTGMPIPQAAKLIQTERPARPSQIDRTLRGDLETIVLKALDKDRDRRYESAADLAQDIARYLNEEPIEARPPSFTYQLRMLARRNRGVFIGLAAVLAILVCGVAVSTAFAVEASRAREAQSQQQQLVDRRTEEKNHAVFALVKSIIHAVGPQMDWSENQLAAVFDDVARELAAKFSDDQALEVNTQHLIAGAFREFGHYGGAERHDRQALEIARSRFGDADPLTLSITHSLVDVLNHLGRVSEAEALARPAYEVSRRTRGEEHFDTIQLGVAYANALSELGRNQQAESLLREILPQLEKTRPADDQFVLMIRNDLAISIQRQDRLAEAEAMMRPVIATARASLKPEHSWTMAWIANYGLILNQLGRHAEAEANLREALEFRKRLDPDSPETLGNMHNLAMALENLRRHDEAEQLWSEAISVGARVLPTPNRYTAIFRSSYGHMLTTLKRFEEAERMLLDGHRELTALLGPEHERTKKTARWLKELYEAWGKPEEVEKWNAS